MSLIQRFFLAIFPKSWGESMRADSEAWHIRCTGCGRSRSVWDCGGIRWKAYSAGKRTLVRCSHCGGLKMAEFVWTPAEKSASHGPE